MKRRTLMAAACAPLLTAPALAQQPLIRWPAIELLDGSTWAPSSWQGQAAVVVFWATYCPYCRRHNAHVQKLHEQTQGQPLRVLGVVLDADAAKARRHMATHGLSFPVTADAGGTLRPQFTSRRVIPVTGVVDRQGRLVQSIPGEMAEDDVLGLARVLSRPVS
jgi:peroxiredoxin